MQESRNPMTLGWMEQRQWCSCSLNTPKTCLLYPYPFLLGFSRNPLQSWSRKTYLPSVSTTTEKTVYLFWVLSLCWYVLRVRSPNRKYVLCLGLWRDRGNKRHIYTWDLPGSSESFISVLLLLKKWKIAFFSGINVLWLYWVSPARLWSWGSLSEAMWNQ